MMLGLQLVVSQVQQDRCLCVAAEDVQEHHQYSLAVDDWKGPHMPMDDVQKDSNATCLQEVSCKRGSINFTDDVCLNIAVFATLFEVLLWI